MTRTALLAGLGAALVPAALVLATPALAQAADATLPGTGGAPAAIPDTIPDTITVGIGAAYIPDFEGSNHYRVVPAPGAVGTFKGVDFTLAGPRLTLNFFPQTPGPGWNVEAGPVADLNFNRTSNNNISDARVRRLPERGTAIEVGGYIGLSRTGLITSDYDKLTLSTSVRWDVSGKNKSYVVTPALIYFTPLSTKAAVGLVASGSYVGAKYAQYYYGVSRADSLVSGLPEFNPSHDWSNYLVGGFAAYSLTGNLLHGFKIVAGGLYSRSVGPLAKSPLTTLAGSRNQFLGAAGLAYTF